MVDLNSFFNPDVKVDEDSGSTEFRPSFKNGKAGIYTALVRFLPDPSDPAGKSIRKKNVAYLTNPITQESRYVDCPSSVGKPDPILDTFFHLRNSGDAVKVENSKHFSRKQKYTSIIQILACDENPKAVNGIFSWTYGKKVYDKIVEEMNPAFGNPRNPFDIINGRPFMIKVVEQSGYNNFDQCKFMDLNNQGAMKIKYKDQWVPVNEKIISNQQGQELVFNYLKENTPDMEVYEYHDWTPDMETFVKTCINYYTNNNPTTFVQASNILNGDGGNTEQPRQNKTSSLDQILGGNVTKSSPAPKNTATQQTADLSNLQLDVPSKELSENSGTGFDQNSIDVPGLDNILGTSSTPNTGNKGSEDSKNMSIDDILGSTFM